MDLSVVLFVSMLLPPPNSVETRIVNHPASAVILIGLPCGDEASKIVADQALESSQHAQALMQSASFSCGLGCQLGVRVAPKANVKAVRVGVITVYDRKRSIVRVGPSTPIVSLQACNGERVSMGHAPDPGWPVEAVYYYVAETTFEDGRTWKVQDPGFTDDVLRLRLSRQH